VEVETWGPGGEVELERAPGVLGQSDSLEGFDPSHPLLRDLHRRFAGLRLTRTLAVLEALVPTVFEQKVIGLEARRGYSRMVRALGEPVPGPRRLLAPPGGERLRRTPYWAFHPFALEQRRANVVINAAAREAWLDALAALPAPEARERMTALPGIGPWTSAEVSMVAFGDADGVPVGDYHLPNVVSWAFTGEARGDDARMLELLEPYRGHRGRVIRLLTAGGVGPPRRGPRLPLRHLERA
jgi:3-methyladenine DNA glycosylase/8-oxoguanine DNA glycosylase